MKKMIQQIKNLNADILTEMFRSFFDPIMKGLYQAQGHKRLWDITKDEGYFETWGKFQRQTSLLGWLRPIHSLKIMFAYYQANAALMERAAKRYQTECKQREFIALFPPTLSFKLDYFPSKGRN